jgi:protein CpxP
MKKWVSLATFALGLALFSPALRAEGTSSDTGANRMEHEQDRMEHLTKKLNLTADQQTKVKAAMDARMQKMKSLHETFTQGMKSAQDEFDSSVIASLNDDQKKKFAEMKKDREEKMSKWKEEKKEKHQEWKENHEKNK